MGEMKIKNPRTPRTTWARCAIKDAHAAGAHERIQESANGEWVARYARGQTPGPARRKMRSEPAG